MGPRTAPASTGSARDALASAQSGAGAARSALLFDLHCPFATCAAEPGWDGGRVRARGLVVPKERRDHRRAHPGLRWPVGDHISVRRTALPTSEGTVGELATRTVSEARTAVRFYRPIVEPPTPRS